MFVVGGTEKKRTWDVRPYRASDRAAVREIAVESAWLGPEGPAALPDPHIWAEIFTRYFTDEGYLTGNPGR